MKIKLTFLGAARNVTGSRFLVETDGSRVLVDCGLYQERHLLERNWQNLPLPARKIDAVILTHAHLDHCGWLPKLAKEGFKGKIYCTEATAEIAQIVLLDAAHLQEEDARYKQKRHAREGRKGRFPAEPLYTTADAEAVENRFRGVEYDKRVKITDGLEAVFHNAGHILGAASVTLAFHHRGEKRTILFSGDVGRWDKPILKDPGEVGQADYVVIESTYGDRVHPSEESVEEPLAEIINLTHEAGGNIVVPSFAVERAQEILYHVSALRETKRIPRLMVFLDSPMAAKVTEVFRNHPELYDREMRKRNREGSSPFEFPGLQVTQTSNDSKAINQIKGTVLIIAGSGMCTGGRIKHHLVNNIQRPESTILFVGYQAVGTLGRQIAEGNKEVRIFGQPRQVRARVARVNGFSGHADRNELMRWLASLPNQPRKVFVVHGETEAAENFADHVRKEKTWKVEVPEYMQKVVLE